MQNNRIIFLIFILAGSSGHLMSSSRATDSTATMSESDDESTRSMSEEGLSEVSADQVGLMIAEIFSEDRLSKEVKMEGQNLLFEEMRKVKSQISYLEGELRREFDRNCSRTMTSKSEQEFDAWITRCENKLASLMFELEELRKLHGTYLSPILNRLRMLSAPSRQTYVRHLKQQLKSSTSEEMSGDQREYIEKLTEELRLVELSLLEL